MIVFLSNIIHIGDKNLLYIIGDIHNTTDMPNLSSKNMKLCCLKQNIDSLMFYTIQNY